MGAEPKATGGPVKPGAFVENDCDYVIRPGAAGMVGPIWGRDALDKIEREAEERGYRKAIADLRDDEAFDLWFSQNLGRHPYPGEEKRRVTADFLESRLTGGRTGAIETGGEADG